MNLSQFITVHIEEILREWDTFARTLFPAAVQPRPLLLRDHAREILQAVVQDVNRKESSAQQREKSEGKHDAQLEEESAAAAHGTQRQASGFTLIELTAEYRALRATVMRLWTPHMGRIGPDTLVDITRFNEAVDQALAESVVTYSDNADRSRDTFLAILGHDLRSPLSTISMAGNFLTQPAVGSEGTRKMGARVARSAANMKAMINDLLEYARTQLGDGIPLSLSREDVGTICKAALDDAQAGHPHCLFTLDAAGDLLGSFDGARLQQVFSNLLNNAGQYRSGAAPVTVTVRGDDRAITVQVRNHGPVIPAAQLQAIFDPLVQLSVAEGTQQGPAPSSLGLGLFIAREITEAHAGTIGAESNAQLGTVFTVKLPRSPELPPQVPLACAPSVALTD